jgi:hypothetical protein
VWQAHIIKHPFGLNALMTPRLHGGKRRWDEEGWHTGPQPVISAEARRDIAKRISALSVAGNSCRVSRLSNEEYGGDVPNEWEACYRCPPPLAEGCAELLKPVSDGYARVVEDTLALLHDSNGKLTRRATLAAALWRRAPNPGALKGLAVLSVGVIRSNDRAGTVARVNCSDGIRIEFQLDASELRWRTTYRKELRTVGAQLAFLMDFPETPVVPLALSDMVLIPRQWSEENGVGP